MANHKSSVKRAKQEKKRRMTNKMKNTKAKTAIKAVKVAVEKKETSKAMELFKSAQSLLSKLAKGSAMSKKTAARKTSRIAKKVNQSASK